jgi:hypothetical protein
VATLHVQVTGAVAPVYAVKLEVAADPNGSRIVGQASVTERDNP